MIPLRLACHAQTDRKPRASGDDPIANYQAGINLA